MYFKFTINKVLTMLALYLGYIMHTYSRRSFQNVINYVLKEKSEDTNNIGMIVTCEQIGYTVAKFSLPFVIDRIDSRYTFISTMAGSFIFLINFSNSHFTPYFCGFYFLNGFSLGFAWPTLIKILKAITEKSELASWWSIQCTSSNVASISSAIVAALIADQYGWRNSMRVCAVTNLTVGLLVATIFFIVKVPNVDHPEIRKSMKDVLDGYSFSFWKILTNSFLICNSMLYFCVYFSRYVIADWYQVFLSGLGIQQIKISEFLGWMEFGGTLGSLTAGFLADVLVVNLNTMRNPRIYVVITCGMGASIFHYFLAEFVNEKTPLFTLNCYGFMYGMCLYGPVTVSAVIAMESVPMNNQGLSFSINAIYCNVAVIFSGYPMSVIAKNFGWNIVFKISYSMLAITSLTFFILKSKATPLEIATSEIDDDDDDMINELSVLFSVMPNHTQPKYKS